MKQNKPDQGRLLTDDCYVDGLREKAIPLWETLYTWQCDELRQVCKYQRDLTASLVRAECGAENKELKAEIERLHKKVRYALTYGQTGGL